MLLVTFLYRQSAIPMVGGTSDHFHHAGAALAGVAAAGEFYSRVQNRFKQKRTPTKIRNLLKRLLRSLNPARCTGVTFQEIVMTRARREQVSLLDTPYYHCVSRCVRRAFLCGEDAHSGACFEHRRQWIAERLALLEQVFAIDIAGYAIMSNHYHLVLHVNCDQQQGWSDAEVIERWLKLFRGPPLIHRFLIEGELSAAEREKVAEIVADWRERLADISWFMRCLNEYIARQANQEDGCTGRFWEGRFKCQPLLDEQALLTCMAYVDLNPLRAGIADTPEDSDFTSVQQRASGLAEPASLSDPVALQPLSDRQSDIDCHAVPFALADYLELVDWTGRCQRDDKRGYIPAYIPPILERLHIDPLQWRRTMFPAGLRFPSAVGCVARLKQYAANIGGSWVKGMGAAQQLYS